MIKVRKQSKSRRGKSTARNGLEEIYNGQKKLEIIILDKIVLKADKKEKKLLIKRNVYYVMYLFHTQYLLLTHIMYSLSS